MTLAASRAYPSRPFLAASIAVFRDGLVLLAERAVPPGARCFSLPGGLVEPGEGLEDAALRELREETGVEAEVIGFNDHVEVVERDPRAAWRRISSSRPSWAGGCRAKPRPAPKL